MKQTWITNHINKIGKKKKDLAAALGLAHTRVSEIVVGKRQLKISEVNKFAVFMEMTSDEVLERFSRYSIKTSKTGNTFLQTQPSSNRAEKIKLVLEGGDDSNTSYDNKEPEDFKERESKLLENFRKLGIADQKTFVKMSEVYASKK